MAQFPPDDLSSLIPGDPPDEDFSKAKPSNQVSIGTFNTYIEPYFRPYSEEDLAFLRERGDRVTPFITPNLGVHYSELWAEEEGPTFASPAPPTNSSINKNATGPKGRPDDISEDQLDMEEISTGPLLSRVLAAMIPEDLEDGEEGDSLPNGDSNFKPSATAIHIPPEKDGYKAPVSKADYATMEDRIRREMVHVGLLNPDDEPDFEAKEDDELCARLRLLQGQLRQQAAENGARKTRVMERLKEQMAYQEYVTILEDLDKQVTSPRLIPFPIDVLHDEMEDMASFGDYSRRIRGKVHCLSGRGRLSRDRKCKRKRAAVTSDKVDKDKNDGDDREGGNRYEGSFGNIQHSSANAHLQSRSNKHTPSGRGTSRRQKRNGRFPTVSASHKHV